MKIKLLNIFNLMENGAESFKKLLASDLPISLSYKLGKVRKSFIEEQQTINEKKQELLIKYGKPMEGKPGFFQFPDDANAKLFSDEFNALLNTEIEIDFDLISIGILDGVKLSTLDLDYLEFLLDLPDESASPDDDNN